MDEIISYKMCAVKVRNAKLRNYIKVERRKAKAKMMYKLLNNMGPQSLTNLFTYKSEMTSYNLRNVSSTLCLPQPRTNNLKKSFMYFGILFLRKLKRANPFLPFGRKSLLTLIIKANICICKYIITSYTISYILILNIFYTMFSIL
jgi:hypothetical protein